MTGQTPVRSSTLTPTVASAGKAHFNTGTYDLRRLRLHQIIERIPHTNRYHVTPFGLQVAMFFSRTYSRLLRTGLSEICDPIPIGCRSIGGTYAGAGMTPRA